jgi:ABC-2 type transport system permease protein
VTEQSAEIHPHTAGRLLASELTLRRRATAVWCIAIALLVVMVVATYPSIRDNPSLDSIYQDMSPAVQALLGGSDLTSPTGYLSTQLYAFFLPAVVLVFAVGRGAAAIAGEEEDRTLDLLLAQPLSRRLLYVQKAAALAVGLLALTIAGMIPVVALNNAVQLDLPVQNLVAISLQMGLFCLALALIAQAVAAALGSRGLGIAVSVGYAVVSYFVYGVSQTADWLEPVRPLTLWRWYLDNEPLANGLGVAEVAVMAGVCATSLVLGVVLFERRNTRA